MLFDSAQGLLRVLVMSVMAYAALVLVLRVAGKRSLAKLNAFDLVVTVAFGSTFATILLTSDVAFAEGLAAFAMLALLQWFVSRLSIAIPPFRRLVRSDPRLLVEDGAYRHEAMAAERITVGEVEAAIRGAGVARLDDVAAVVLESDGSLSTLRRSDGPSDVLSGVRR